MAGMLLIMSDVAVRQELAELTGVQELIDSKTAVSLVQVIVVPYELYDWGKVPELYRSLYIG